MRKKTTKNSKVDLTSMKDIIVESSDSLLKAFLENDEITKALFKNDVMESIPYLKTVIAIYDTTKNYKEFLFKNKIYCFLKNIEIVSEEEANRFADKIKSNNRDNDLGVNIIEIIDKMDSINKAALTGKLFTLMLRGEIGKEKYFRICYVLSRCFYDDLVYLKKFNEREEITGNNDLFSKEIIESLSSYGLLSTHGFDGGKDVEKVGNVNNGTVYILNDYGKIILKLI